MANRCNNLLTLPYLFCSFVRSFVRLFFQTRATDITQGKAPAAELLVLLAEARFTSRAAQQLLQLRDLLLALLQLRLVIRHLVDRMQAGFRRVKGRTGIEGDPLP